MNRDSKTVWENEETVYETEETMLDSENIIPDGATVLDDATVYDDLKAPSVESGVSIEKGNVILDTYGIESDAIEGGMGKVWRVHHKSWNVDLAMKQPKAGLFQSQKQKENFIHECEAWINLGLHPHIVSCYYVREIDATPTIFSEWMDGGSLKNIIEDSSLYGDGVEERILDIAIQFARGLHYAHEQGLIHQDVKPDNLLLTKNGEAKVADFGIAKARATATLLDADIPENETMFSMSGGYTPAYASIEQVRGEKLTRRTDIYSWAVSVMEMYLGERPWQNGVIAGAACESYFPKARVAIPKDMKTLLKECLNEDEVQRPHDFSKVEKRLLGIYKDIFESDYARTQPKAAADTADSLNNRALSFIDLGRPEDAEKCWEKALEIDPNHVEAVTNYALWLWRSGKILDIDAVRRLEVLNQNKDTWLSKFITAKIHMERGDRESAVNILTDILNKSDGSAEVKNALELASDKNTGWRINPPLSGEKNYKFECFSPDGKNVISLHDKEGSIKVWDIKTRKVIQTFSGHERKISSVCFSSDGKYVLSGSDDKTVKIWDIATGNCLQTYIGHSEAVHSVCFSPDAKYVLSSSKDTTLKLWNAESGECLHTFAETSGPFCFSPDGKLILSQSPYDNATKLWNTETGECLNILKGHSRMKYQRFSSIKSVCFSPDGKFALSGSTDKTLKLWDIKTSECIRTFTAHSEEVISGCFSPDGNYVLSVTRDRRVKLWDIRSGDCLLTFSGTNACFSTDGKWVISDSLQLWDIKDGKCIYTIPIVILNPGNFVCVYFSPDGQRLMYAYQNKCYLIQIPKLKYYTNWTLSGINTADKSLKNEIKFNKAMESAETYLNQGKIEQALNALQEAAAVPGFSSMPALRELNFRIGRYCRTTGVLFFNLEKTNKCKVGKAGKMMLSPDGKHLASVDMLGINIKLFDIITGEQLHLLTGHKKRIYSICFSPEGSYILSTSSDNTVKVWDVTTGECLRTIDRLTNVDSALISPDSKYIFTTGRREKLWSIKTGKCLRTYKTPIFSPVCFSPEGMFVLTKHGLYDVKTGKYKWSYKGNFYSDVCMSPDGKYILTSQGLNGESLCLRDNNTGECLREFPGNFSKEDLSFSPDGNYVLSWGTHKSTFRLWDINTCECLRTLNVYEFMTEQFSSDGNYIIAAGRDGTIYFYRLDYEYEFPGWADWDEGARPYLEIFLALHPNYTDDDFDNLISDLQTRGYGWLRPDGVRAKLEEMQPKKKGLFGWIKN